VSTRLAAVVAWTVCSLPGRCSRPIFSPGCPEEASNVLAVGAVLCLRPVPGVELHSV